MTRDPGADWGITPDAFADALAQVAAMHGHTRDRDADIASYHAAANAPRAWDADDSAAETWAEDRDWERGARLARYADARSERRGSV